MSGEPAPRRKDAARWLRTQAAGILEHSGVYLDAETIWVQLKQKEEAPGDSALAADPEKKGVEPLTARSVRILRRSLMDDGPRVIERLLGGSGEFCQAGRLWGLAHWPIRLHLRFRDQALHAAFAGGSQADLESAVEALFSLPLSDAQRDAYEQIAAELRRQLARRRSASRRGSSSGASYPYASTGPGETEPEW